MRSKYFENDDFLFVFFFLRFFFVWRIFFYGRDFLVKGFIKMFGNGLIFNVWTDLWFNDGNI